MKKQTLVSVFMLVVLASLIGCTKKDESPPTPKAVSQTSSGPDVKAMPALVPAKDPNILELIGQLDSDNSKQIGEAIKKLEALGQKAELAIPALMRRLGDRDVLVRLAAERALVAIGPKAAKAMVQSNDKSIIAEYPLMLSKFGPSVVVPIIAEELPSVRNSEKFMNLLLTLGMMGESAKEALPTVRKLKSVARANPQLEAFLSIIETQILEGREGLENIAKQNDRKLAESKKRLEDLRRDFLENVDQAIAFKFSLNPPGTDALLEKVSTDLEGNLPEVEMLLASDDFEKRIVAGTALFKLCERDKKIASKVLPKIKRLCSDEKEIISLIASLMVNRLGDKTDYTARYVKTLKDFNGLTEVLIAMGGLIETKARVTDMEAQSALRTVLQANKDETLSLSAAVVLVNSGVTEEAQKYAERLLSQPNSQARINGAALIAKIGAPARSSIDAMRSAEKLEHNGEVKDFIGLAISSLGEVEDDLQGLIAQAKRPERVMAFSAFQKMEKMSPKKKRESIPYLVDFIRNGSEDLQDMAIMTLCSYGEDAEPASSLLIKLLESGLAKQNASTQFRVVTCMGKIGKSEFAPLLFEVLVNGESGAANSAKIAISDMGSKAKVIVPDLLERAKNPKYREEALAAINSIGILETAEHRKQVAGFLGDQGPMTSFYAAQTIAAQGVEVSIPIFEEAVLSIEKDMVDGGFTGLHIVAKTDPVAAVQSLERLKTRTNDPNLVKDLGKSIEQLKKK